MVLDWLTAWYNLPALFALAVAVLLSVVQIAGGLLPDALDVDVDADADLDLDVDLPLGAAALGWIGVGRAPLTVLLLTFLLVFGAAGLVVNAALPVLAGVPTLGVTFVGAGFVTGRLAAGLNRLLPAHETLSHGGQDRVGREGIAASPLTPSGGQVQLGPDWIDAVVRAGGAPIPKGAPVLVVAYEPDLARYVVEPL